MGQVGKCSSVCLTTQHNPVHLSALSMLEQNCMARVVALSHRCCVGYNRPRTFTRPVRTTHRPQAGSCPGCVTQPVHPLWPTPTARAVPPWSPWCAFGLFSS